MNCIIDKLSQNVTLFLNLKNEDDKQLLIAWLKQIQPKRPQDQLQIDECIIAAGGRPESNWAGYDTTTQ